MIDIISRRKIVLPFKYYYKKQISEVNGRILVIDEEFVNFSMLNKQIKQVSKLYIIVLAKDNVFSDTKVNLMYQNNIDYFIKKDSVDEQLILILKMLKTKYHIIDKVDINVSLKQLTINDNIITLTKKEAQIYEYLLANRGKLCNRKEILAKVLGYHQDADTRVVDVYIKHLRTKIQSYNLEIKTERGKGYILY
ncbi:MAG: winged helix-turn-helix domain-containing protein [Mycoplasmatales bacterium]